MQISAPQNPPQNNNLGLRDFMKIVQEINQNKTIDQQRLQEVIVAAENILKKIEDKKLQGKNEANKRKEPPKKIRKNSKKDKEAEKRKEEINKRKLEEIKLDEQISQEISVFLKSLANSKDSIVDIDLPSDSVPSVKLPDSDPNINRLMDSLDKALMASSDEKLYDSFVKESAPPQKEFFISLQNTSGVKQLKEKYTNFQRSFKDKATSKNQDKTISKNVENAKRSNFAFIASMSACVIAAFFFLLYFKNKSDDNLNLPKTNEQNKNVSKKEIFESKQAAENKNSASATVNENDAAINKDDANKNSKIEDNNNQAIYEKLFFTNNDLNAPITMLQCFLARNPKEHEMLSMLSSLIKNNGLTEEDIPLLAQIYRDSPEKKLRALAAQGIVRIPSGQGIVRISSHLSYKWLQYIMATEKNKEDINNILKNEFAKELVLKILQENKSEKASVEICRSLAQSSTNDAKVAKSICNKFTAATEEKTRLEILDILGKMEVPQNNFWLDVADAPGYTSNVKVKALELMSENLQKNRIAKEEGMIVYRLIQLAASEDIFIETKAREIIVMLQKE